jgi:peptidoglycan hydrolase-like protein with peptidoglycan-binding domain
VLKRNLLATALLLGLAGPAAADYSAGYTAYVAGNYPTALMEFEAGARAGDARAQYMMGRMYAEGRGTPQDFLQAHAWYNVAAANGYSAAATARDSLGAQMTPSQVSLAQSRALALNPGVATSTDVSGGFSLRQIQQLLNARGFDAGPADGVIGNRTRTAIRAYQANYGLPVTGAPSASLQSHLLANPGVVNTTTTTTIVTAVDPAFVREIQTELRRRGYAVSVNGLVDPSTQAAIRTYQSDAGLPVNGLLTQSLLTSMRGDIAGPVTVDATHLITSIQSELRRRGYEISSLTGRLDASTVSAIQAYQADAGLAVTGQPSQVLLTSLQGAPGTPPVVTDRGLVQQIQAELNAHGYAVGAPDGVLGPRTRDAIRTYQSDANLPITGQPSQTLLASLQTAGGSTGQVTTTSNLVLELEQELARKGYAVGPVDGVLDVQTSGAIRQYQSDARLTVTGEASNALLLNVRTSGVFASTGPQSIVRDITNQIFNQLQDEIGQ